MSNWGGRVQIRLLGEDRLIWGVEALGWSGRGQSVCGAELGGRGQLGSGSGQPPRCVLQNDGLWLPGRPLQSQQDDERTGTVVMALRLHQTALRFPRLRSPLLPLPQSECAEVRGHSMAGPGSLDPDPQRGPLGGRRKADIGQPGPGCRPPCVHGQRGPPRCRGAVFTIQKPVLPRGRWGHHAHCFTHSINIHGAASSAGSRVPCWALGTEQWPRAPALKGLREREVWPGNSITGAADLVQGPHGALSQPAVSGRATETRGR